MGSDNSTEIADLKDEIKSSRKQYEAFEKEKQEQIEKIQQRNEELEARHKEQTKEENEKTELLKEQLQLLRDKIAENEKQRQENDKKFDKMLESEKKKEEDMRNLYEKRMDDQKKLLEEIRENHKLDFNEKARQIEESNKKLESLQKEYSQGLQKAEEKIKTMEELRKKEKEEEEKKALEIIKKKKELEAQLSKEVNDKFGYTIESLCKRLSEELPKLFKKSIKPLDTNKLVSMIDSLFTSENFDNVIKVRLGEENENYQVTEIENNMNHFNILLLGPSGVGKSTLINAILNLSKEKEAKTASGDPQTMEVGKYTNPDFPGIRLWDSRGIEYGEYSVDEVQRDAQDLIKSCAMLNDPDQFIHCIWYCMTESRFHKKEREILDTLMNTYEDKTLPVIIVYTKATRKKCVSEMRDKIEQHYPSRKIEFCPVVAKKFEGEDAPISGIPELIQKTAEKTEGAIESAFFGALKEQIKKKIKVEIEKKSSDLKKEVLEQSSVLINETPKDTELQEMVMRCSEIIESIISKMVKPGEEGQLSSKGKEIVEQYLDDISHRFLGESTKFMRDFIQKKTQAFYDFCMEKQLELEESGEVNLSNKKAKSGWVDIYYPKFVKILEKEGEFLIFKEIALYISKEFEEKMSKRVIESYYKALEENKSLIQQRTEVFMKTVNTHLVSEYEQKYREIQDKQTEAETETETETPPPISSD